MPQGSDWDAYGARRRARTLSDRPATGGKKISWVDGVRAIGCILVLILYATQNVPAVIWLSGNVINFGRLRAFFLVVQRGYLVPRLMALDSRPSRFWVGRVILRFHPVD